MSHLGKDIKPSPRTTILILSLILLFSLFVTITQDQYRQNQAGRAATTGDCTATTAQTAIDSEEQNLFDTINSYRQQQGKGALKLSPSLTKAASWMSNDMATKNYANHTDSLGRTPDVRLKDCGYTDINAGENLSQGPSDAASVFNGWKASTQGHNENMLNATWKVMGVSRTNTSWVVDFGATDDSTAVAVTAPVQGGTVPSPVCAGSGTGSVCPITSNSPAQIPSGAIQNPVISVTQANPSASNPNPVISNTTIQNPITSPAPVLSGTTLPGGTAQPGAQGILGILIALIMLILNFLKSLFGF